MTPKEKRARALDMFVAGATYRAIADKLEMTEAAAEKAILAELAAGAGRRHLLASQTESLLVERTEALFRAHYPGALRGDHHSARICIDLLTLQLAEVKPAMTTSKRDELAKKRAERQRAAASRRPDAADTGGAVGADERSS